jgi:hypothetical protein
MGIEKEWIAAKPTKAGVYRVRGFVLGHPREYAVVEVATCDGELRSNLHERNSDHETNDWSAIDDHSSRFEWQRIGD